MKRLFLSLSMMCLVVAGCGYTTGSLLPVQYKTLHVAPFVNKVEFTGENSRVQYVPLLENKVRTAIVDRFQFDGNLRLSDSDKSDLVLKGELIGFERDDLRSDDDRNIQEYRLRVIVALTMVDNTTGEVFWSEGYFAGEASYFTTGAQAKSESAALDETLKDLARRVVERTVQNW